MDPNEPHDPAYPTSTNTIRSGVTLRDYFAARAMQGDLAAQTDALPIVLEDADAYALRWYRLADAMLRRRAPEMTQPQPLVCKGFWSRGFDPDGNPWRQWCHYSEPDPDAKPRAITT